MVSQYSENGHRPPGQPFWTLERNMYWYPTDIDLLSSFILKNKLTPCWCKKEFFIRSTHHRDPDPRTKFDGATSYCVLSITPQLKCFLLTQDLMQTLDGRCSFENLQFCSCGLKEPSCIESGSNVLGGPRCQQTTSSEPTRSTTNIPCLGLRPFTSLYSRKQAIFRNLRHNCWYL